MTQQSVEDILLVTWILSWDVHALAHHPVDLFQGNILFPTGNVLARSELLLGDLPIFAPILALTGNPVLALNAVTLTSFVLTGLFMHLLIRRWAGSEAGAYVAGLGFAFALWRLRYFHWPHLLAVQYFPLILLTLDHAVRTGRARIGILAGLLITLQVLCSFYLAYMTLIIVGSYLVAYALVCGVRRLRTAWLALLCTLVVPAAVLIPLSLPYLRLSGAGELDPGVVLIVQGLFGDPRSMLSGFVGYLPALVAAFVLIPMSISPWRRDRLMWARVLSLLLTAMAAIAISPGEAGLFGGRVTLYSWLATIVPGFSLVRASMRFGIILSFALSACAGLGVAGVWALLFEQRQRVLGTVVFIMALVLALSPLWRASGRGLQATTFASGDDVPAVYRWLARHGDGGPLLELPVSHYPVRSNSAAGAAEVRAMYFSTFHWLPIVNGYTGYVPASYNALRRYAACLPNPSGIQVLIDCTRLRWILLHQPTPEQQLLWSQLDGLKPGKRFPDGVGGEDWLYEVTGTARSPCPIEFSDSRVSAEPVSPQPGTQSRR